MSAPIGPKVCRVGRYVVHARFVVEKRDLWLGCYWESAPLGVRLYVCILPCVPLVVDVLRPISFDNSEPPVQEADRG